MGYFNYFIKCVIRKFVNMLFKPKMFFALLIIIGLLFAMNITARAEWTDEEIQRVIDDLESIAGSNINIYQQLEQINTSNTSIAEDVVVIRRSITSIDSGIYEVIQALKTTNSSLEDVKSQLSTLLIDIENLNTQILNIYNSLEENQQELLTELEKDNQAVLEELNMIRDAINGTEEESTTYTDLGIIHSASGTDFTDLKCISINYEPRYSYKIKVYYANNWDTTLKIRVNTNDNKLDNGYTYVNEDFTYLGTVPANSSSSVFNYNIPSSNPKYLYFTWGEKIEKIEVYRSIMGIVESLNQSNDLQQQQNQFQQESNQLQQEQNDFLSKPSEDSDVSVDSFNNVDSNDITSSGLSGVFNTIYNSITSWNAKNINLPIPYTNKSIIIPANYTESMLSNSGGFWVINFIHAVYYFIVGRFMIYSITNIINSIKSGSILNTDSKNNITTDML